MAKNSTPKKDGVVPNTPVATGQESVQQPAIAQEPGANPTHVNAFKQEVTDAFAEAHKALTEAEDKYNALVTKYEA